MMLHIISAGSSRNELSAVMPALVAGIHAFVPDEEGKTWMPGTRPGMTSVNGPFHRSQDAPPRSRGTICPGSAKHHPRKIREGAGNAGCFSRTRSLVCERWKHTSIVTTGWPNIPAFPARWCYGLLRALPGDRAFLPPSFANWSTNLTPASRRQNHAAWPSAGSLARLAAPPHVHRIPRSTFVTTRNAPPDEHGTGLALLLFLPNQKAKYFSQESWTRRANQCRGVGTVRFARPVILRRERERASKDDGPPLAPRILRDAASRLLRMTLRDGASHLLTMRVGLRRWFDLMLRSARARVSKHVPQVARRMG